MKTNNQTYEAIRELICLGFYSKRNFNNHIIFLGEYQYNDKQYQIHWSFIDEQEISIFIKCGDNSIQLIIEEVRSNRPSYTSAPKDVFLHINEYRNINFKDVSCLYFFKDVNKENIIYNAKIQLDYLRMHHMCINPNEIGSRNEEKRYIFDNPEHFDKILKNKLCIEVFKDEFSPEIILNLIDQIYTDFKRIIINNKIDRIIASLSSDELIILKERLQENQQLGKKMTLLKGNN